MVIDPIGTFVSGLDAAAMAGLDGLLQSMTSAMADPITWAAICFYAVQGLRFANGDPTPRDNFVPQLIRVGVVIWLSSNLVAFDTWVRDVIYLGLPAALGQAVAAAGGANTAVAQGVDATAAAIGQVWLQMWGIIGAAWSHSSYLDFGAKLGGVLTGIIGGLGLLAMALVYIGGRFVFTVIIGLAPVLIGCAMFDTTKPIFERAVGKVVALICLQVAGLIVLQLVLGADQAFIGQIMTNYNASNGASSASELQIFVSMIVLFCAGAFAMLALPSIAYSIGTGVALSAGNALIGAAIAAKVVSSITSTMKGMSLPSGGGGAPNYSVSMAPNPNRAIGGQAALPPPPPPPSIASSTRS